MTEGERKEVRVVSSPCEGMQSLWQQQRNCKFFKKGQETKCKKLAIWLCIFQCLLIVLIYDFFKLFILFDHCVLTRFLFLFIVNFSACIHVWMCRSWQVFVPRMAQNALCSCCSFAHLHKVILTEQVEFVMVSELLSLFLIWSKTGRLGGQRSLTG